MESPPVDYGNTEQGILLFTGDVSGIFAEITHNDNACLISFSPYFAGAAAFELVNTTGQGSQILLHPNFEGQN